jgi:hypothetical protein
MVENMTVFPAKMKAAELHLMSGAPSGVCAITAGNPYALTTMMHVMKADSSTQRPVYGSEP